MNPTPDKYRDWIRFNVPQTTNSLYDVRGHCQNYSEAMVKEFPELELRKGFYHCPIWGKQQHWWCTLVDQVIDPTVHQFPSGGLGVYEPVPEDKTPLGKCLNCGDICFEGAPSEHSCTEKCQEELVRAYS